MRFPVVHQALLALVLVGCAIAPPAPPAAKAVALPPAVTLNRLHGNPGETMEFLITLRGITVGRVQTAVGQPGLISGRQAIIVKSQAIGEGVIAIATDYRGELTTTLDLERGAPMSMRKEEWMVVLGKPDHNEHSQSWGITNDRHEAHSAAGLLRGWISRPGDRATFRLWFGGGTEVTVVNSGRVLFPVGNRPAIRYDGTVGTEHPFTVWISDDTARVPLRMRAPTPLGVAEAELVHYDAPRD
ncbi:MAG: DUF3108 domain-containing protein [Deltaproteobacteria bacterium]|nr:DUF3108 domain-containing protein [Deltaproteobacteria bacterium]